MPNKQFQPLPSHESLIIVFDELYFIQLYGAQYGASTLFDELYFVFVKKIPRGKYPDWAIFYLQDIRLSNPQYPSIPSRICKTVKMQKMQQVSSKRQQKQGRSRQCCKMQISICLRPVMFQTKCVLKKLAF